MIVALHGFLGLPGDWAPFERAFHDITGSTITLRKWNLYDDLTREIATCFKQENSENRATDFVSDSGQVTALSAETLRSWAQVFCDRWRAGLKKHGADELAKPVLMGYSMGGRLAMHALVTDPQLWSAAVIVSGHPGLVSDDLKLQRQLSDTKWAERILHDDWAALIKSWDDQEVFRVKDPLPDAIHLRRAEEDFDRKKVAASLCGWSLAGQTNLRPLLADLDLPVLWVTGADDKRYHSVVSDLMMDLVDSPFHEWAEVPRAGHRVPWDSPSGFSSVVREFLSRLG